jgi:hypothetical protein
MSKNKIILSTPGYPWQNNQFSVQGYYLTKIFFENNYDIIYVPCSPLLFENFTDYRLNEFKQINIQNIDDSNAVNSCTNTLNLELFKSIKYCNLEYGNDKDIIYVNSFNKIIEKYSVDYIFILSDLFSFTSDDYFKCKSLIWFPNQNDPLDKKSRENLKLFDKILCLCPSSINVIKKYFCNDTVILYSSFIIDYDYISELRNKIEIKNKIDLKKKHNVPTDSIIITIMAINHDHSFKKGFDISFQVFEKILQKCNNVFLYVYAPTYRINDFNNDLEDVMGYLNIPKNKYHIQKSKYDVLTIEEIYNITDIMLIGSKTESSGLILLESQIRGIPVVSTKFLAMKDFTYYGITCDYEQKFYDGYSGGFICMPSVKNMSNGVYNLINNLNNEEFINKKNATIERLKFQISYETIKNQILDEVKSIIKPDKYKFCFIIEKDCEETRKSIKEIKQSSFIINSNNLMKLKDIRYHYLVILQYKCKINPLFFNLLSQLSIGVVLKTKYIDGTIHPNSKDELLQYGKYNNIIVKSTDVNSFVNLTEDIDFNDFYNDIMIKYIEIHQLAMTEHVVVENI